MYYTKYRPQKFSEIAQPNDTASALMKQLSSDSAGHAYLFVGPRGTGKTTTARILAKALNCEKLSKDGDPCLECASCIAISSGSFVDLIEIDAASNRGIDDIRDLKEKIKLAPSSGSTKVYIIDEVHMLTTEAFNALLKTLEEPPKHAVFILCTTEFHKVPDTIKSRCQVFKFKRASRSQLVNKLDSICKAEKVTNLKKSDLEKIADASFGGFRDAETLLQQVVEGNMDPNSFLGLSTADVYYEFVGSLMNSSLSENFGVLNRLIEEGIDLEVWNSGLLNYLRDLLHIKSGISAVLDDFPAEISKKISKQSDEITFDTLVLYIEEFLHAGNIINSSVQPNLPLELALVKLSDKYSGPMSSADNLDNFPPDILGGIKLGSTQNIDIKTDTSVSTNGTQSSSQNLVNASIAAESSNATPVSQVNVVSTTVTTFNADLEDFGEDYLDDDIDEDEEANIAVIAEGEGPDLALEVISESWKRIVKEAVKINTSVHTLLKSSAPVGIVGNTLEIEVLYKFHKERIETPKNTTIIQSVIEDVVGHRLNLNCIVNPEKRPKKKLSKGEVGELTDANISAPVFSAEIPEDITSVFDGGLPM